MKQKERPLASLIAGIDLGGTKILAGIADQHGHLVAEARTETPAGKSGDEVVEKMAGLLRQLLAQVGAGEGKLSVIAVGAPGPLDPETGIVRQAPNLGWRNFPLADRLARHFRVPVYVDNDANLAGLGEYEYGFQHRFRDLLYVTVSTGIGGGIIINGGVYHGVSGGAGEFGHMVIIPDGGPGCSCGGQGCLETLASGTAIAARARELIARGGGKALLALAGNRGGDITARTVGAAAMNGDGEALDIVRRAGYYLGIGLANLVHVLNPAAIVIGGGVANGLGEMLLGPARQEMRRRVMPVLGRTVEVLPGALGDRSGLLGCLVLARRMKTGAGDISSTVQGP